MTNQFEYPLEQVLEVKIRRVEQAEKVVKEKKQALEREQEKLKEREAERDKVLKHRTDKLNQLRDELDHGTTSDKVQQMKAYLKVVDGHLKVEQKKVADQKEQVKLAENALEEAKLELARKRNEVDKLEIHKEDWIKEAKREMELAEEKEMDEVGSVTYLLHLREKKTLRNQ